MMYSHLCHRCLAGAATFALFFLAGCADAGSATGPEATGPEATGPESGSGEPRDLGLPPGSATAAARAINDRGQVAVTANIAGGDRIMPFLYDGGTYRALAPNEKSGSAEVVALNDEGVAAGFVRPAGTNGVLQAALFTGGVVTMLPTGASTVMTSVATGINDAGQVVGWRLFSEGPTFVTTPARRATLWRVGRPEITDLAVGAGSSPESEAANSSAALAVNDVGLAVGFVGLLRTNSMPSRSVVFVGGLTVELTLPADYTIGQATAVNDQGLVAGTVRAPGVQRAVVWVAGRPTILEPPPGYLNSEAHGINEAGDVVGDAIGGPAVRSAVLWRGGTTRILPPIASGADATAADINNRREVVGASGGRPVRWTVSP